MIYYKINILLLLYIILLYYLIVSECVNPAFCCYMKQAVCVATQYAPAPLLPVWAPHAAEPTAAPAHGNVAAVPTLNTFPRWPLQLPVRKRRSE